jgi:hypothetical protein
MIEHNEPVLCTHSNGACAICYTRLIKEYGLLRAELKEVRKDQWKLVQLTDQIGGEPMGTVVMGDMLDKLKGAADRLERAAQGYISPNTISSPLKDALEAYQKVRASLE